MIEVIIKKSNGHELAHIKIENVTGRVDEFGDYSVQFGVDTGVGPAIYQRSVAQFPRRRYNVLALLRLALDTLEEKDLRLDANPDDAGRSSDLARRFPRARWPF